MKSIIDLFSLTFGCAPSACTALPGAGSNRRYFRLTAATGAANAPATVIGVAGTSERENESFVYLASHFRAHGLPVPEVFAVSADGLCYLQEDLGSLSLYDALRTARQTGCYGSAEVELLKKTIRLLPHFQLEGSKGLDAERLLPPVCFNEQTVLFDLNYFKYCFLRTTDTWFDEVRLQADLERFALDLTQGAASHFLYRDFQARNVMLRNGEPVFIDFQGGRLGPLQYDVAAFLWQASARYSPALRQELTACYLDELRRLDAAAAEDFEARLPRFVLFRLLQVLGAYGLRGRFERKQHFLDSIPPALSSLKATLDGGAAANYPHLADTLRRLCTSADGTACPETPPQSAVKTLPDHLTIRIFSFSYKRGIPQDESGNGGGYVFDCRAPHNPGRYDEYKALTGLDAPVIRFLEQNGEMGAFLESVYRLADFHVQRYIDRGFTSLMFSFGCTGGQHRSVYAAQHLAEHLSRRFGVEVVLCHREQGITQHFPPRP